MSNNLGKADTALRFFLVPIGCPTSCRPDSTSAW